MPNRSRRLSTLLRKVAHPVLPIFLFSLAWFSTAGLAGETSVEKRPNILLLVVDTLRRDHCSAFGYDKPTTPHLEKLVAEGVRFDQHFSGGPWTTPSLATLFTGRSAAEHGLDTVARKLPDTIPTLAERLRAAGYHTVGVLCNPCAGGSLGFARGFDLYDDFTIPMNFELNLLGDEPEPRIVNNAVTGPATTKLALRRLRAAPKDKPWFAFVLYFDPHEEYVPEEPYRVLFTNQPGDGGALPATDKWTPDSAALAEVKARYDAEIRATDDQIGELLAKLREEGLFGDDDLLVVTSDHGEEFRDHGGLFHGGTYFDELVRAPLILRWPSRLPAGRVADVMTAHEDLGAALLAAAGGTGADGAWPAPKAGVLALAEGTAGDGRDHLALGGDHGQRLIAWRTAEWLVVCDTKSGAAQTWKLDDDPGQQRPFAPDADPESTRLAKALGAWHALELVKRPDMKDGEAPELTERDKAALRALGYLQD